MKKQHSFIYLLVSEENNIFKIGKADNIINRYEILKSKWGNFNLTNSYKIKCYENSIFKIEKTLQYIFKDFNIIPEYQYDGYTEWFDMKCYQDIITLINNLKTLNSDIIDIQQGIKIHKKIKTNIWQSLSKEERKETVKQSKQNKQQRNLNENIQNATMLINILNDLKDNIIFFNKEQNLIIFQNVNKDKINSLFDYKSFDWIHGGFNFITSCAVSKDLIYLDLQFNYFEEKDIGNYEEINKPYKIIMSFFNKINSNKIETDIVIGHKYKEEQTKLWSNFFLISP
ncbi:MAG: GIY-YIG nuclease family protein [Arcobacteraceae bacterium]|nr:GIY-YIG nuclease family protein [Arcobacteraceae bacterium]